MPSGATGAFVTVVAKTALMVHNATHKQHQHRSPAAERKRRKKILIVLMLVWTGLLLTIFGLWPLLLGIVVVVVFAKAFARYHWRWFR